MRRYTTVWNFNVGKLLKVALQTIWDNLPDETIYKSVQSFGKWLAACEKAKHKADILHTQLNDVNVSVNIS